MKKLFLTMCLTALLSGTAIAACEGGTEYTVDGDTFCISSIGLNWWSASNWCKANGMRLATIYEVCPDWNGNANSGKCGRTFFSGDYVFTATASESGDAFCVHSSGTIGRGSREYSYPALCTN